MVTLPPLPGKGSDEGRRVGPIAERLADLEDVLLHHLGGDVGPRPEGLEDLLLGDEPIGVLDEVAEEAKRLGRHRDALAVAPEALVDGIETERVELLHGRGPREPAVPKLNAGLTPAGTETGPRGHRERPAANARQDWLGRGVRGSLRARLRTVGQYVHEEHTPGWPRLDQAHQG